jgi:hypothetical protein
MRTILQDLVEFGNVLGTVGPGRTILAVTVDKQLIDTALGSKRTKRDMARKPLMHL